MSIICERVSIIAVGIIWDNEIDDKSIGIIVPFFIIGIRWGHEE